jgi:hypothetical protein
MYAAWEVQCNSNQADVTLTLGTVNLKNQTFIFDNYTNAAAPAVTLNGVSLNDGSDMFTSVDTVNKQLYITFNSIFIGSYSCRWGCKHADLHGYCPSGVDKYIYAYFYSIADAAAGGMPF